MPSSSKPFFWKCDPTLFWQKLHAGLFWDFFVVLPLYSETMLLIHHIYCVTAQTNNPGLTSQRNSALISSDSEYFQVCFSAVHYLKISEQRWFSSEQSWKRKFSQLKISAETALFSSETELIQSWTALIFSETELIFSETALKHQIFRAKKQRWIRAVSALIFSETELNSADFLWHSAEKPKIQSKKNQFWISAVSALIFLERELIPTEAFLNSSHHSWFSPETTLNIPRHLILFPQTSAGKLRS